MFRLVTIIEKSKIIREGLSSLLRTHSMCQRLICLKSFEECPSVFNASCPELIFINPDQLKESPKKTRSKYHLDTKILFVGIIYGYCHKEVLDSFDETIYITDSEEVILNKLKNLHKQRNQTYSSSSERLTDREKDVLKLLIQGFSNKEVADKLTISPHTDITHRKNIIEKTGIRSLAGLAVYAILNNIAEIGDIQN
jgi:DNA-binding NarL/FixJ family response regulator